MNLDMAVRSWQHWTADQNAFLISCRQAGWTLKRIANEMQRPIGSVRRQAERLKSKRRRRPASSDLTTLTMRANDLCWDLETLGALLAASDAPAIPPDWRTELIAMAARVNELYALLARERDKRP